MCLERIFISAKMVASDYSEMGALTSQVPGFLPGPHGRIPRIVRL